MSVQTQLQSRTPARAQEDFINKSVKKALSKYFAHFDPADEDYLFKSRKGQNQPMTVSNANMLVKGWCRAINLEGNYGTHTMRKTFGYFLRRKYGVGWELLARWFNHSSSAVPRNYLSIQDDEVKNIIARCSI